MAAQIAGGKKGSHPRQAGTSPARAFGLIAYVAIVNWYLHPVLGDWAVKTLRFNFGELFTKNLGITGDKPACCRSRALTPRWRRRAV
jgi:hypothetical protein